MTRFERELAGEYGVWWKQHAEAEIEKMQKRADNDEIRTNMNGAAFWNSNGNYLPENVIEVLKHTDFDFDPVETAKAREAQTELFLQRYRENRRKPSSEELWEMKANFGKGSTVVDVISGERYEF